MNILQTLVFNEETFIPSFSLKVIDNISKNEVFDLINTGYIPHTTRYVDISDYVKENKGTSIVSVYSFDNDDIGSAFVFSKDNKICASMSFNAVKLRQFRDKHPETIGFFFHPVATMLTTLSPTVENPNRVVSEIYEINKIFITTLPLQL